MNLGVQTYQQLKPCIGPGHHKFIVSWPPAGPFGYRATVCERCGMSPEEARRV